MRYVNNTYDRGEADRAQDPSPTHSRLSYQGLSFTTTPFSLARIASTWTFPTNISFGWPAGAEGLLSFLSFFLVFAPGREARRSLVCHWADAVRIEPRCWRASSTFVEAAGVSAAGICVGLNTWVG